MDYEKKYKEALERAKDILKGYNPKEGSKATVNYIFPELHESEDERIRKRIIQAIKIREKEMNEEWSDEIAWLEKQGQKSADIKIHEGDKNNPYDMSFEEAQNYIIKRDFDICCTEYPVFVDNRYILQTIGNILRWADNNPKQKLIDNIEPKFKVGDWVIGRVTDNEPRQIAEITEEGYKTTYDGWIGFSFEEDIHLWSIEDAKPGDVLVASDGSLFIFAKVKDNSAYYHISLCKNGSMEISDGNHAWETASGSRPATKEQRDMLFQKMHEAGYKWDAGKKELKLLITNGGDFFESKNCGQKPAWSEEDEDDLNNIIWLCNNCISHCEHTWVPSQATRIKSLIERIKDTVFLQPKQQWSEEDKEMIEGLNNCLDELEKVNGWRYIYVNSKNVELNKVRNWLKFLKQRIGG